MCAVLKPKKKIMIMIIIVINEEVKVGFKGIVQIIKETPSLINRVQRLWIIR